ncbi:MAG: hypothetical protein AB7T31_02905 [Gemmatimonadales bacterium]
MTFQHCLFCRAELPENGVLAHVPRATHIAYDPERGRLWAVCPRCRRWSLAPVEERDAALHELERTARDGGRAIAWTANVTLLAAGPLRLVRVGAAGLAERAAWRYGSELVHRRRVYDSGRSRLAAYTWGALHSVGRIVGVLDEEVAIDWKDAPVADVLRWRRFGWAAWHGHETCPHCLSTLRALRYDLAWWVYPLRGPGGRLGVGVPCQRCDLWTPDKLYALHGDVAENVLRRLLAYVNVAGASDRTVADAVGAIEHAGSVETFAARTAGSRRCLWKLGATGAIGLEIALGETAEDRMLELGAIEFVWRREEELARIVDEELTPRRLLEAHLRRLPIRVSTRALGRVARVERA